MRAKRKEWAEEKKKKISHNHIYNELKYQNEKNNINRVI